MNNIYLDKKNLDTFVIKSGVDLGGKKYKWVQIFLNTTDEVKVKPLTDRLAEERKRVVQEIRDLAGDYFEMPYCDACGNTDFNDVVLTGKDLTEILDDVERGE